jgi:ABC-type transport system involved in multi-copper enzyme maturation permease subunit
LTKEKEDGTLRLQFSNSLARAALLAGKLLGIVMTLLPVLVFCFLLGGLIVLFSGDLAFSAREWGRLASLSLLSLGYLTLFILAGLFVSSRTKSSVSSLVFCLFVWVLFVFIVPQAASHLAESLVPTGSRDNLTGALADMDKGLSERVAAAEKKLPRPDWFLSMWSNNSRDGEQESYGCSASFFEHKRQLASITEPLRVDNADAKWGPQSAYLESLSRQARAAERLAMVSPAGIFRAAAMALCGTDRRAQEKELEGARRYRETFIGYLRGKDLFNRFEWLTPVPPSSFLTADAMVETMSAGEFKTLAVYQAWAEKQTDFRKQWEVLVRDRMRGAKPEDYPFLGLDDMPRFAVPAANIVESLTGSAVGLGLLFAEGLVLFALAFVAFIRFDVR